MSCVRLIRRTYVLFFRGAVYPWKQVIYFQFSQNMKMDLLKNLIFHCEASNACVRGIVFDMGNHTLMKELGIFTFKNHFFKNPVDENRKIFIFPDIPHCFKRLRNHILDHEMVIKQTGEDDIILSLKDFEDLMNCDNGEFKYCCKLSRMSHLYVTGNERQRVRPAVQLLSASVSLAMVKLLGPEYEGKSNVIMKIDRWFDTMNSRKKFDKKHVLCGLGKSLLILFIITCLQGLPLSIIPYSQEPAICIQFENLITN